MARKFKSKRRIKISKLFKWIIIIIIIFYIIKFIKNSHISLSMFNPDDEYIKYILDDCNNYSYPNKKKEKLLNVFYEYIKYNFFKNPRYILSTNLNYKLSDNDTSLVSHKVENPSVYIYNSHQKESYSMEYLEDYNIVPNVLMVSYMIKERLKDYNIDTIVEDNDISAYLQDNNMEYYQSYEASRYYLKKVMEKYDNISLFLDVHRDAISHDDSTTLINGLKCARIMFVVGLEHDNYQANFENMNHLNDMIKEKYPNLTRGVLKKEGVNVNGIYNQDLSPNIMLMEIGGNYNNIEEVLNTVDLVAPIIGEYINEKK